MTTARETPDERALMLGALVAQHRLAKSWSQAQLGKRAGLSQDKIWRIERAKYRTPPSDEIIRRLAAALEVDPRQLLRAAGRRLDGQTWEDTVLDELEVARDEHAAIRRRQDEQTETLARHAQALAHMEQVILKQLRTVTKELKQLTSDSSKAKPKNRN
jgi:transcriptional regulator with XRE-family HTH domain